MYSSPSIFIVLSVASAAASVAALVARASASVFVEPIVYSLPPIVTFLPASRAPAATLKVALVAPSVSVPLRPAS